jgi:hypothetical protein
MRLLAPSDGELTGRLMVLGTTARRLGFHRLSRAALLALGVCLAWAYALILQAPASGMYHDDGIYLVTGRALAEGEGYRIISLPDAPPQTKYPILFPFLLSLVWRIVPSFPNNLVWLRAVRSSPASRGCTCRGAYSFDVA